MGRQYKQTANAFGGTNTLRALRAIQKSKGSLLGNFGIRASKTDPLAQLAVTLTRLDPDGSEALKNAKKKAGKDTLKLNGALKLGRGLVVGKGENTNNGKKVTQLTFYFVPGKVSKQLLLSAFKAMAAEFDDLKGLMTVKALPLTPAVLTELQTLAPSARDLDQLRLDYNRNKGPRQEERDWVTDFTARERRNLLQQLPSFKSQLKELKAELLKPEEVQQAHQDQVNALVDAVDQASENDKSDKGNLLANTAAAGTGLADNPGLLRTLIGHCNHCLSHTHGDPSAGPAAPDTDDEDDGKDDYKADPSVAEQGPLPSDGPLDMRAAQATLKAATAEILTARRQGSSNRREVLKTLKAEKKLEGDFPTRTPEELVRLLELKKTRLEAEAERLTGILGAATTTAKAPEEGRISALQKALEEGLGVVNAEIQRRSDGESSGTLASLRTEHPQYYPANQELAAVPLLSIANDLDDLEDVLLKPSSAQLCTALEIDIGRFKSLEKIKVWTDKNTPPQQLYIGDFTVDLASFKGSAVQVLRMLRRIVQTETGRTRLQNLQGGGRVVLKESDKEKNYTHREKTGPPESKEHRNKRHEEKAAREAEVIALETEKKELLIRLDKLEEANKEAVSAQKAKQLEQGLMSLGDVLIDDDAFDMKMDANGAPQMQFDPFGNLDDMSDSDSDMGPGDFTVNALPGANDSKKDDKQAAAMDKIEALKKELDEVVQEIRDRQGQIEYLSKKPTPLKRDATIYIVSDRKQQTHHDTGGAMAQRGLDETILHEMFHAENIARNHLASGNAGYNFDKTEEQVTIMTIENAYDEERGKEQIRRDHRHGMEPVHVDLSSLAPKSSELIYDADIEDDDFDIWSF